MLIQITKPCGCTGNAGTMPNAFVLAGHRLFAPRRTLGTRLRAHFGASTFSERLPVRSRQRRPIGFSAPLRGCAARDARAGVAHLLTRPRCLRHAARSLRLRVSRTAGPGGITAPAEEVYAAPAKGPVPPMLLRSFSGAGRETAVFPAASCRLQANVLVPQRVHRVHPQQAHDAVRLLQEDLERATCAGLPRRSHAVQGKSVV